MAPTLWHCEPYDKRWYLPGTPDEVYTALMTSRGHAAFSGANARVRPKVGTTFMAWGGYIHGKNLKLVPGKTIVQSWVPSDCHLAQGTRVEGPLRALEERPRNAGRLYPLGGSRRARWASGERVEGVLLDPFAKVPLGLSSASDRSGSRPVLKGRRPDEP